MDRVPPGVVPAAGRDHLVNLESAAVFGLAQYRRSGQRRGPLPILRPSPAGHRPPPLAAPRGVLGVGCKARPPRLSCCHTPQLAAAHAADYTDRPEIPARRCARAQPGGGPLPGWWFATRGSESSPCSRSRSSRVETVRAVMVREKCGQRGRATSRNPRSWRCIRLSLHLAVRPGEALGPGELRTARPCREPQSPAVGE